MNHKPIDPIVLVGAAKDFWHTHEVKSYHIPSIHMNDGPHGVRGTNSSAIIATKNKTATCFPTSSALASSWNPDLIYQIGKAIGKEAKAHGIHALLGPGINLKRTPLGGRNFEYYSEDPCLTAECASSFVKGIQINGVAACLKHFILNEQEIERMTINCMVDEKTLFQTYLWPFREVIRKAHPWMVMASYNQVNGDKVSESTYLLTEVLRQQLQFDGVIVSDWGAVENPVEALKAGLDFDMPYMGEYQTETIQKALQNGDLDHEVLEARYKRVKDFSNKLDFSNSQGVNYDQHYELAYQAAVQSIVLLKNDKQLLPLNETTERIGIIGDFFRNPRIQGAGSSKVTPYKQITPEMALRKDYSHIQYSYLNPTQDDLKDDTYVQEIQAFAKNYKTLILFAGLEEMIESEGIDRHTIRLSSYYNQLINIVYEANQDVIIILNNGTAVSFDKMKQVNSMIEAWLPGEAMGEALWAIVFGRENPSGKLSETFPISDLDLPMGPRFKMNETDVVYSEGVLTGYKYYDYLNKPVHFEFGFGLSYSEFKLDNYQLIKKDKRYEISLQITNVSSRKGMEVIQLYMGLDQPSQIYPMKELKRFIKIEVKPNQSRRVAFTVDSADFESYNTNLKDYVVVPGIFNLYIGTSSRRIHFTSQVESIYDEMSIRKTLLGLRENSLCKDFYYYPLTREPFMESFSYLKEEGVFDIILDMPLNLIARLFPDLISKECMDGFLKKVGGLKKQHIKNK